MPTNSSANHLFGAADEFQQFCNKQSWKYCFIGGLAVLRWGEIRMTQDIDLCLLCGFGSEEAYVTKLLETFQPRINNAVDFALKNRVFLVTASNGTPVDISLSGLPFEEEMVSRATCFEFSKGCSLLTCSAEDLIILKAFADRSKDWIDIEGIILRQAENLNQELIFDQLSPFCDIKGSPETIPKLKAVFVKNQ